MKNLWRNRFLLRQNIWYIAIVVLNGPEEKNKTGKVKNVSNYIYA